MKKYFKLLRVKHYLKNFLIFLPLVFSGHFTNQLSLFNSILAFFSFSFVASVVYIINDIRDKEKDKNHPTKKYRPIASNDITIIKASIIGFFLLVFSSLFLFFTKNLTSGIFLIVYLLINIFYSFGLKNIPLVDVCILVLGFLLRVLYGASIIDVGISSWLYLTVISMSFYLSLGKRRNEISGKNNNTRDVLKYYTQSFLDKNMYMCLSLTIVFYSLWAIEGNIAGILNPNLIWTVPIIIIICMKYSMNIESNSDGDPVEVVFKDKFLLILLMFYSIVMIGLIYV